MHYKNGIEVQVGDVAKAPAFPQGYSVAGVVGRVYPDAVSCNLTLVIPLVGGVEYYSATAGDCELLHRPTAPDAAQPTPDDYKAADDGGLSSGWFQPFYFDPPIDELG